MWKLVGLLAWIILVGCSQDQTRSEKVSSKIVASDEDSVSQQPNPKITWRTDGAKMILIPAGNFEMGDHLDGLKVALPVHTVELDAFYMDIYEVTMGQYKKFIKQKGVAFLPPFAKEASPTDKHPVVGIKWEDAVAYAEWAGKRLPTEAEWEYAARGGLVGKRFPWGDEGLEDNAAMPREYANFEGKGGKDKWKTTAAPVGSFSANGYGLYDMAGNVFEWVVDWYDPKYYNQSPKRSPKGPKQGQTRVLRGGSWNSGSSYLRVADRDHPPPINRKNTFVGFRCVADVK